MLLTVLVTTAPAHAARDIVKGPAIVKDDGSLVVDGKRFALYGIQLAQLGRDCRQSIRPVRCGERAVLALDNQITSFVHCQKIVSKQAVCTIAGERLFDERIDLAFDLLLHGLALARPNAPAHYRRLEEAAKSRKAGVWGRNFIDIR